MKLGTPFLTDITGNKVMESHKPNSKAVDIAPIFMVARGRNGPALTAIGLKLTLSNEL